MTGKEISPCSNDSILTGGYGSMEDHMCPIPSAPAAGKRCLSVEEQGVKLCSYHLEPDELNTAGIMYYYTACMRAWLLCHGSRHYCTFQNMASFSHQFIQQ